MNNYYTLIYLNEELNETIAGGFFCFSISPHKDVLECYIETGNGMHRLVFGTNPNEIALFLDTYRPPKKHNVTTFFERLKGQKIIKISLADRDRLIYISFENGVQLQFVLYGANPNVYLLQNGRVAGAFKNSDKAAGDTPIQPQSPNFSEQISPQAKSKNQISRLNPLLPRNLLPYLIEQHNVDEMGVDEVRTFVEEITQSLLNDPHPRVLKTGDLCLWPETILHMPVDEVFDTVNQAILHAYRNAVRLRRIHNKREGVERLLDRTISKKQSQLAQLKQADKSLERADEYEKFGHLLMANAHVEINQGMKALEVQDFYRENEAVQIPLKEGHSVAENAEYYYEKAKSARTSYKEAKRRIPGVNKEITAAKEMLEQLKDIEHVPELEAWVKQNQKQLRAFGYGTEDNSQASSPYRKFKAGKYEIWVGKSAKSNDQLTTLAHKEDIWLHARGVGGSHVVIRMGNRKDYPPKEILLRAAGYAAYYSKAKGMKSAPVMYTKRKYVHKPKGAAPGAVVVEREQVELVPPLKPEKLN